MAQITVRDLALGYDSHVIADKLNFSVSSGDYLCIVGENGSGTLDASAVIMLCITRTESSSTSFTMK